MSQKLEAAVVFAFAMLAVAPFASAAGVATPVAGAGQSSSSSPTVVASAGENAVALAKEEKEDDDDKDEKKDAKGEDKEEADEETISIDKAPAVVQEAIKKALGDNKLEKLTKEEGEDGEKGEKEATRYEASFKDHGANHTISFLDSGKIVEDEQEIKVSDLPEAVTHTVNAKMSGAKIVKAERVKTGDKSYYEVTVGEGKHKHELKVDESGKIVEDEKGKEKDDDEKEGKEKK